MPEQDFLQQASVLTVLFADVGIAPLGIRLENQPGNGFGHRAEAGFAGSRFGCPLALQHLSGDVLDLVDDVTDLAVWTERRRVQRRPPAHLESPIRAPDVVLLHRHSISGALLQDLLKRGAQVARPGGPRSVGFSGKASNSRLPTRPSRRVMVASR